MPNARARFGSAWSVRITRRDLRVSSLAPVLAEILNTGQAVEIIILSPHNGSHALRGRVYNAVSQRQLTLDSALCRHQCQRRVEIDDRRAASTFEGCWSVKGAIREQVKACAPDPHLEFIPKPRNRIV